MLGVGAAIRRLPPGNLEAKALVGEVQFLDADVDCPWR